MAGGKSYWLECSEIDKPYDRTFWYRCFGIEKFIDKVEIKNTIMVIVVDGNNIGFVAEGKKQK